MPIVPAARLERRAMIGASAQRGGLYANLTRIAWLGEPDPEVARRQAASAGLTGTAAMTVSSTLEARLRKRQASSAPARATAKVLGIKEFEDDIAAARYNDLSHWGYGPSWGVLRGLLGATGMPARTATALHGAAIYGSAQVTLPALEIAPPVVFWPKEEIAIDAFHHAVCAAATGLAYELISKGGRQG